MIKSQLVDMRNWHEIKDQLIAEVSSSMIVGYDIETEDSGRHDGLNQFMKVDAQGHKSKGKSLVFDVNRTIVCGFSWYCDKAEVAYYLNLAHADVENRIPWAEARQILDAKHEDAHWICHNGTFEITMMLKSLGFEMKDVVCTLQLAVSAFNEDQYPDDKMFGSGFGGIASMLPALGAAFVEMDPNGELTEKQSDLLGKIIGKSSSATFSYNHIVKELSYGYGLKKLTKSMFNYDQASFEETLKGKAHMGQITGEECCAYGAEDAYWAVRLFHRMLPMLAHQNPGLITTFFEQENPMIYVFADIWGGGMKINLEQVERRRQMEREVYAEKVIELQKVVRSLLPFPDEPNKYLMNEGWYSKSKGKTYRSRIEQWAKKDLPQGSFATAHSTAGAVSNAWADEVGVSRSKGPNFSHYMMMRTLLYDLPGIKPLYSGGKVASDKDARAKLEKKTDDPRLIQIINEMAGIEQRMKLYLTPYLQLCDPETQRVYPVVSSMLNSRRMAARFPNPMQLAKRGESTYIRGFYEPDQDDHVIVSIDWSQIELVLIGELSGDEAFADAYGQLPYKDLHARAVSELMDLAIDEVTKDLRNSVGKVANFNYWYSGALSTVGQNLGWSSDRMWEMTERYRETFAGAEEWRVDLINEAREKGFVTLPDGHRRHKFEASYAWQNLWRQRFESTGQQGLINFGNLFIRRLTNRAANQVVNSMIQGSCATLAKRSILAIKRLHNQFRFRFLMPIHDELVFSVHKDDAIEFIREAKRRMCDHPGIFKNLKVDATASMGRTFEPYHPEKAPFGQMELDEAPPILGFTKDQKLDDLGIQTVINYLFEVENNDVSTELEIA